MDLGNNLNIVVVLGYKYNYNYAHVIYLRYYVHESEMKPRTCVNKYVRYHKSENDIHNWIMS